jgi:DnaK suppressor protein
MMTEEEREQFHAKLTTMQLQEMSQEASRRRQQLLVKIEGALRRIESGRFGLCFLCGE